ncbi:MAG: carbohydrate-binding family 9-like protein [Candidatus Latescibacteria bacterium]|nr:carbohydrate-binding family 9-like protein [Candidatus Latescibacterota bacterium]
MSDQAAQYTCRRAAAPLVVDGDLGKGVWAAAARTPRFGDSQTGNLALLNTRAALLWSEAGLHAAFWLEERDVWTTGAARTALVWQENCVTVAIAGPGAYYELSLNPANRTSELFFIWKDAYTRGGRYDVPEFDLARQRPMVFGGDNGAHHPRGMRWAFLDWHFPGLRTAVKVDGTLDHRDEVDRGWSAEICLSWEGLGRLADGPLPPEAGQVWRIGLARTQMIDHRAHRYPAVWTPYATGCPLPLMPDAYTSVVFAL